MSGDDQLKDFVGRAQAAQAAADQVIADNHRRSLAEVLERLQHAQLFAVPLTTTTSRPQLVDLMADVLAAVLPKVTAKNRTEVSRQLGRLERRIRAELEQAFFDALAAGNRVASSEGDPATRWAYQTGVLNGALLAFLRGGR